MATATPASSETQALAELTEEQRQVVLRLRARYQAAGDELSAEEMERLRFLRWLIATGRIAR